MTTLFSPLRIGTLALPNRLVMSPLTRNRAAAGTNAPTALNATYYAQRASAGLIISEATDISADAVGSVRAPGMYTPRQIDGWRRVADAVHASHGRIFAQLWHVGRISHASLRPGGAAPVAPSALQAKARVFDGTQFIAAGQPRALEVDEIRIIVRDFALAARNACAAGLDGIEIHGANGYLIDQFLQDSTNRRTDDYGGSLTNRARFLFDVVEAASAEWPGRVGLRLAPFSQVNDMADSDPMTTFGYVIERLNDYPLAYLHMPEGHPGGSRDLQPGHDVQALRRAFKGVYMANNGYDRDLAMTAVETGRADLIAFGRAFLANPDLVDRLARNAPLNVPDTTTFYGGDMRGYTDYPPLEMAA